MLSPHEPLEKIQPNCGRELLTCMGRATAKKLTPLPGEGLTGQISFNLNQKVNFKVFIPSWSVFSQMKDTKHIRRIFFLSPGSCPRGVTRGYLGGKN